MEKKINKELNNVSGGNDIDYKGYAVINDDYCVYCMSCVDECPVQAINSSYQQVVVNPSMCIGERCHGCIDVCPTGAIKIVTRRD